MGDGRWEMGDGRWETGDGRRETGDGRRETGDKLHTGLPLNPVVLRCGSLSQVSHLPSHIRSDHAKHVLDRSGISSVENLNGIPKRRDRPRPRQPSHRLVRRQPLGAVMLRTQAHTAGR